MEQLLSSLKAAREDPAARLSILNQLHVKVGVTCTHLLAHLDKVSQSTHRVQNIGMKTV